MKIICVELKNSSVMKYKQFEGMCCHLKTACVLLKLILMYFEEGKTYSAFLHCLMLKYPQVNLFMLNPNHVITHTSLKVKCLKRVRCIGSETMKVALICKKMSAKAPYSCGYRDSAIVVKLLILYNFQYKKLFHNL